MRIHVFFFHREDRTYELLGEIEADYTSAALLAAYERWPDRDPYKMTARVPGGSDPNYPSPERIR